MKIRFIVPALLIAATFVSPASANWFSNPKQNVNRYIGSTPNPKPQDVRENRQPVVTEDAAPKVKGPGFLTRLLGPAPGHKAPTEVAQSR